MVLPEKAVEGLLGKTTMQHIASQQSAGGLLVGGRGSYSLLVWELALCHQEGSLATVRKKYPKSLNTNSHSWVVAERQWLKSRFNHSNSPNHSAHLPRSIQSRERERERQVDRPGEHRITGHTRSFILNLTTSNIIKQSNATHH